MKRKILIVRFSSIGDLILTTPIIRCLKKQLNVEIHLITKAAFNSVLINNPYIDKHWSFEKSVFECIDALKDENFNIVVDLQKNLRSFLLRTILRKTSYSFDKINFKKWLMCNLKLNFMPDKHLVDRYFDGVQRLKVNNDGKGLDYFFKPNQDYKHCIEKLPDHFVAGVLGAAHRTKQIPFEKWREIIEAVELPIVLIGGGAEISLGQELEKAFPGKFVNCAGQFSIDQSAAILANSRMVITPDTGMMHIAAALRKPMHVVWGNTIPGFGMYPYFGNQPGSYRSHEVMNLKCRPCSKLGFRTCPKNHFKCMMQQEFSKELLELEI